METLNQIIALMDRKEVRNFKIYMQRVTEAEGRKDLRLFDAIRTLGDKYDEEKFFLQLYGKGNKNAFYRLKNRLTEDLHTSLFEQYCHTNENIHTFFLLGLAYLFVSRNEYSLAMYQLKKAEKKARQAENYSLLNIIYSQMMIAARELNDEDPEYYIEKRKENRGMFNKLGEVDDILVAVEYRMMKSQNLAAYKENILEFLRGTIDKYTEDKELKNSARLQFGLYLIVSRILLQNKDYTTLEVYLKKSYDDFSAKKLFNKNTHHHKLQILSWIANALFMNKKYNQSLEYATLLHKEMERYDRMLYDRFAFFYYNCQVINYSEINPRKAIEILSSLAQKGNINKLTFNGVFVYLNLAVLYYGQRDYSMALKNLNKLYSYPEYNSTDPRIKLRVSLGELMMRTDRGEREIAVYRIRQISKEFESLLSKESKIWEHDYLRLFSAIHAHGDTRKIPDIKSMGTEILGQLSSELSREEMLFPYDEWLKEKAHI
jgi:hypothetical protein